MKDIKSKERSLFSIHEPQIVKLFSRRRLDFSHLNEHKFRHKFKECMSPMCACGLEIASNKHFFFHCHFYYIKKSELLNSLYERDLAINELIEDSIINLVLYLVLSRHKKTNRKILLTCILMSNLLNDLMNHLYICVCVIYIYIYIYIYVKTKYETFLQ